jgi:hypothetical protein
LVRRSDCDLPPLGGGPCRVSSQRFTGLQRVQFASLVIFVSPSEFGPMSCLVAVLPSGEVAASWLLSRGSLPLQRSTNEVAVPRPSRSSSGRGIAYPRRTVLAVSTTSTGSSFTGFPGVSSRRRSWGFVLQGFSRLSGASLVTEARTLLVIHHTLPPEAGALALRMVSTSRDTEEATATARPGFPRGRGLIPLLDFLLGPRTSVEPGLPQSPRRPFGPLTIPDFQ